MILAAIIVSLSAMTNTDQTVQSAQQENSYHLEAQAGLLGVGLSIGISSKTDEFYLLRTKADSYVQGAAASIGLHHRKFYTGPHYFEYGVGAMAFGTDEAMSDYRGPYTGVAFGRTFTGIGNRIQFGIEWTNLSILYSVNNQEVAFNVTLPKLTLGTSF